jgi:hypothetical protein
MLLEIFIRLTLPVADIPFGPTEPELAALPATCPPLPTSTDPDVTVQVELTVMILASQTAAAVARRGTVTKLTAKSGSIRCNQPFRFT